LKGFVNEDKFAVLMMAVAVIVASLFMIGVPILAAAACCLDWDPYIRLGLCFLTAFDWLGLLFVLANQACR
jgi:hypothetical protein